MHGRASSSAFTSCSGIALCSHKDGAGGGCVPRMCLRAPLLPACASRVLAPPAPCAHVHVHGHGMLLLCMYPTVDVVSTPRPHFRQTGASPPHPCNCSIHPGGHSYVTCGVDPASNCAATPSTTSSRCRACGEGGSWSVWSTQRSERGKIYHAERGGMMFFAFGWPSQAGLLTWVAGGRAT